MTIKTGRERHDVRQMPWFKFSRCKSVSAALELFRSAVQFARATDRPSAEVIARRMRAEESIFEFETGTHLSLVFCRILDSVRAAGETVQQEIGLDGIVD